MASRGTTHVPNAVIAKLISQAAAEVEGVGSSAGGILGIRQHRDFGRRPDVDVELFGSTAVVTINLGLLYPVALEEAGERVRTQVKRVLARDLAITDAQIDITVSWLHPSQAMPKKRSLL